MADNLSKHVKEQTGHAMDTANYGGHGHSQGKQGHSGHAMPPNDADKQDGHRIPQGFASKKEEASEGESGSGSPAEESAEGE